MHGLEFHLVLMHRIAAVVTTSNPWKSCSDSSYNIWYALCANKGRA